MAWFTSTLINDIVNEHAPFKSKIIKKESVPYMNSKLRKALFSRNMARNKYKNFGKQFWEENRRKRNLVVSIRKKSLSEYFSKNCANKDKSFWKTISPFFSNKSVRNGNNIILSDGENIVTDTKKVADIFNDFFVNVASTIGFQDDITTTHEAIMKHNQHRSVRKIRGNFGHKKNSFVFTQVSSDVIRMKLKHINIRKATGYDNIPGKLLRIAHVPLSAPFTHLINTCIMQNVFPSNMKCAELTPLFKKKDNLCKGNYRPVSILTTISKLYESTINDQLLGHFSDIFDTLLCAFRKGYSCQSLLLKCIDDWKVAIDNNKNVGALFMDLSKAFDCLPHSLLISKLHAYGLTLSACELISS